MMKIDNFIIERFLKSLIFLGLLIIIFIIFSQKIELTSVDLGRHLANGRELFSNPSLLFNNTYSYTEPNARFINHHWLTGLIYFKLYSIGGFKILSLFNIFLILVTFCLVFDLAKRKSNFYLASFLSLPLIFLLSERVEVRPEIFSYLFIFCIWYILEHFSKTKKWHGLLFLTPLFVIWVNIHIYFFIGLALVGFKVLAKFIAKIFEAKSDFKRRVLAAWAHSRQYFINLGIVTLACLLNPNTIRGLLYPFNIFNHYGYEIAENKSIFFLGHLMINPNFTIFKLVLILLILSFSAVIFFKKKINYFDVLLSLFFSLLALLFSRNLSLFSLVALIIISGNLSPIISYLKSSISFLNKEKLDKYGYKIIYGASFLLFIIIISIFYLIFDAKNNHNFIKSSLGFGTYPNIENSADFFKKEKLSGPIFNNYDIGSALIFWLYPNEKVFVDNRPEAYSNKFFIDIYKPMQEDDGKWKEYSEKYKFNTIYFSHTDRNPWAQTFLRRILQDNDWTLIYFDDYSIILVNKKNTEQSKWQSLSIDSWKFRKNLRALSAQADLRGKFYLASLAENAMYPDLAEEIYQEILISKPNNLQAVASLAFLYSNSADQGMRLKSLDYFSLAINKGYKLPGIYNRMGLVNWQLKEYKKAESLWRSALKLDRHDNSALYYLEQVRQLKLQGVLSN